MSASQTAEQWTLIAFSLLLAIALPLVVHWWLSRRDTVRELWLYWRPGTIVAMCAVLMTLIALVGLGLGFVAIRYPSMWATVALTASALLGVAMLLTRYVRFGRRQVALATQAHLEADEDLTRHVR